MDEAAANAAHASVRIGRDLDRPVLVTLMHRIGEMLAAILDPLHWAVQHGRGGHHRNVLRIDAQLGTEAAAHIGRRHAQPVFVEMDVIGECVAQIVRLLGRGPHLRFASGNLGQNAAAFDRMAGPAMLPQVLMQDMRGLGECGVDVAERDLVRSDLVGGEFAAHRRRVA